MRVLALDVSSTVCGYALASPGGDPVFGVIKPRAKDHAIARIDHIVREVGRFAAIPDVELVIMEWSSGRTHRRIAKASGLSLLGAAQGAVRQEVISAGIPVETVEENQWTRGKTKVARASVMMVVFPEYGAWAREGNDPGMDAADALGILEWHRGRALTAELISRGSLHH